MWLTFPVKIMVFVHIVNLWLHFMHNAITFVDALGISADRYESCWIIFFPILRNGAYQNSIFLLKVCSLKIILIILNESSLMVFFCTSFSFISEIADSSFYCFIEAECDCRELTAFLWLIHIKYKTLQGICWLSALVTASAITKITEIESWNCTLTFLKLQYKP